MYPIRRLVLTIAAVVLFGAAIEAQADGLKFGVPAEPYPPFESKDASGKWVGWEIDVMNALCEQMKEKCEVVEVAWDGIIPALTSKQIDVIFASMSITPERKKTISFSNMYYASSPAIIGAKDGDMDITPAHLAGKTIGVQVATIHQNYAEKYFAKDATIKAYQLQDEANQDMAAGRIDYLMANSIALDAFVKSEPGASCCEFKGLLPDDKEILGEGVGAGLRKEDTALAERINAAIKEVAATGKFEEISKKNGLEGMLILPKP